MRHVITGGAGFTGRVLARMLADRGEQVVLFDQRLPAWPDAPPCIQGDIRRPEDLDRIGLQPGDVVHHLAARQFADAVPRRGREAWFNEINVLGTREVLAAMRRGGANRLVFFSTDMVYGVPDRVPVTPDHPRNPLGPYGGSKVAAEALIDAARSEEIAASVFRPRLISGPGRLGILGKLFRLIRAGLPVPMIGSGRNRYQMVSVEDCARAALRAVELGCPPGPFNLGSTAPPTTRELLSAVIRHAGSRSVLVPTPAVALRGVLGMLDTLGATLLYPEQFTIADKDVLLDTTMAREVLGWAPSRDDISAMTAAYDHFLETTGAPGRS